MPPVEFEPAITAIAWGPRLRPLSHLDVRLFSWFLETQWSLQLMPALIYRTLLFAGITFVFFVWCSEQTAIFAHSWSVLRKVHSLFDTIFAHSWSVSRHVHSLFYSNFCPFVVCVATRAQPVSQQFLPIRGLCCDTCTASLTQVLPICGLCCDRCTACSKVTSPHSAIFCFLQCSNRV